MKTNHFFIVSKSATSILFKTLKYSFLITILLISIRLLYNYWIVFYNIFDYKINEKLTFTVVDDYWQITRKIQYWEITYDFHEWKIISYTWSITVHIRKIYNAKSELSEKQLQVVKKLTASFSWNNTYLTKNKKYLIFPGSLISRKYGFPLLYWENVINIVDLESGKMQQIPLYRENGNLYDIADILDVQ